MFKDYYLILEIPFGSSNEAVKKSYRQLALKWHPDKHRDKDTTKKFQEINEAYRILSDEEARSRYDREYVRYKEFVNQKKTEENKTDSSYVRNQNNEKSENKEQRREHKANEDEKKKQYTKKEEYKVYDEVLAKWMENAREQAAKYASEFAQGLVTASKDAALGFFKEAGGMFLIILVITVIIFIITLLV